MLKTIWGKSILIFLLISAMLLPILFIFLLSSNPAQPIVEDLDSSINGGTPILNEEVFGGSPSLPEEEFLPIRIFDFKVDKITKEITTKFLYSYVSDDESITNFLYCTIINKKTGSKFIDNKFISELTYSKNDYFYIDHFERSSDYFVEIKLVFGNKSFKEQTLYLNHSLNESYVAPDWIEPYRGTPVEIVTSNSFFWEFGYIVNSAYPNMTQQLFTEWNAWRDPMSGGFVKTGWSLYAAMDKSEEYGFFVYLENLEPNTEYFFVLKAGYVTESLGIGHNSAVIVPFKTLP